MDKNKCKPKVITEDTISFGGKTYVAVKDESTCVPRKRQQTLKTVAIGLNKNITIRKFGGKSQINIRRYTGDGCGKQYSTKRGIMLTPEEWQKLKDSLASVDQFLEERQTKTKA